MFKKFIGYGALGSLTALFAASPSSASYILKSYDYGSGGASSSSSTYKLDGLSGSQSGGAQSSASYNLQSGEVPTQNANVPPAPTLTNAASSYDRLQLVVGTAGNPSDTKYLIAVSNDGFVTTKYVQNDNSIGSTLSINTYQSYTAWGGASGFSILGLAPATTYQVRVKAIQGNFSESAYGPATLGVATVTTSLSFSVTTTLTASPPFPVNFSSLTAGSVFAGDADVLVGISSNASSGGSVYIQSAGAGLVSAKASFTIPSATADLSVVANGYGAQITTTGQASGGPLASVAPFNGTVNNVGALTTSLQKFLSTTGAVTTGTATLRLKTKIDSITPSAADYTDLLTIVAAMTF